METMKNSNLTKAKKEKNNEFYTQLPDIENELKHYRDYFKDKIVYCNCDSPESNFVKYFNDNKKTLGIKALYHTWYDADTGKGSFNNPESIELLKESDIVVTNPPFSLFREFIDLMFEYDKKFLVIGNKNAITYKESFKHIKENNMWLGITSPNDFDQPKGHEKKSLKGLCLWFTNLPHKKRNEPMILYRTYNEKDYSKYDNYDAIEVSKTKDIPLNYEGVMGVPITFLNSYCPEQFEILGIANSARWIDYECFTIINGKKIYNRILIKNKTI